MNTTETTATTTEPTAAEMRAARAAAGFATLRGRALRAAEIVRAGGYFEERLERNYHGVSQFRTRLYNADGVCVAGFGYAAARDCSKAGILRNRAMWRTSVWASRQVWATAPACADEIAVDAHRDAERDWN